MSITYTWNIDSLKTKTVGGVDNVVIQTYWKKTGTDADGNVGSFSGATPFPVTEATDVSTLTAFADLTEEQVLSWIQAQVVDGYEEHVNAQIQKQIDDQAISEADLPWSTPTEETPTT